MTILLILACLQQLFNRSNLSVQAEDSSKSAVLSATCYDRLNWALGLAQTAQSFCWIVPLPSPSRSLDAPLRYHQGRRRHLIVSGRAQQSRGSDTKPHRTKNGAVTGHSTAEELLPGRLIKNRAPFSSPTSPIFQPCLLSSSAATWLLQGQIESYRQPLGVREKWSSWALDQNAGGAWLSQAPKQTCLLASLAHIDLTLMVQGSCALWQTAVPKFLFPSWVLGQNTNKGRGRCATWILLRAPLLRPVRTERS